MKKPPQKSYSDVSGNHHPGHAVLDNVNSRILTFSSMPNYRYGDHFVAYLVNTIIKLETFRVILPVALTRDLFNEM